METIDRISPTLAPARIPLIHQNWNHLLFLHWEVPYDHLRPLVPGGLSIDLFEDKAYVSLVVFTLTGVRPVGLPALPVISDFHEVNLRTYVHCGGREPGVWFFSLDASSRLAVVASRATYHLPYHAARIHFRPDGNEIPTISFTSHRMARDQATCRVRYQPGGAVHHAPEGSLEFFLAERYVLYARRDGDLLRARVHHQPYPLQRVEVDGLGETVTWAAGIKHGPEAPLAQYAREVNVDVYPLEKVD